MLRPIVFAFALLTCAAPFHLYAAGTDSGGSAAPSEFQQSKALLKEGNHAKAEGLLRKVLADDPSNADAWNLLGYATRLQDNFEQAEEYYGKALAIDAEHIGAMQYLGMLYVKTGRTDDARKLLARIDDACFLSCSEYDDLKRAIETGKTDQDPGW